MGGGGAGVTARREEVAEVGSAGVGVASLELMVNSNNNNHCHSSSTTSSILPISSTRHSTTPRRSTAAMAWFLSLSTSMSLMTTITPRRESLLLTVRVSRNIAMCIHVLISSCLGPQGDPSLVHAMQHMNLQSQYSSPPMRNGTVPDGNGSTRSPRAMHIPRPPPIATNPGRMYPPPTQHYGQGSPHMGMYAANGHGHGGPHMDYAMMGHAPQVSPVYADGGMPSPFFVPPSPSDVTPRYTSSPYNGSAPPNTFKPQHACHPNGPTPVAEANAATTPATSNTGNDVVQESANSTAAAPSAASCSG